MCVSDVCLACNSNFPIRLYICFKKITNNNNNNNNNHHHHHHHQLQVQQSRTTLQAQGSITTLEGGLQALGHLPKGAHRELQRSSHELPITTPPLLAGWLLMAKMSRLGHLKWRGLSTHWLGYIDFVDAEHKTFFVFISKLMNVEYSSKGVIQLWHGLCLITAPCVQFECQNFSHGELWKQLQWFASINNMLLRNCKTRNIGPICSIAHQFQSLR